MRDKADILQFQWRLLGLLLFLLQGRQAGRLLQRVGRLLSGPGQHHQQQGFYGHGHSGFVAVLFLGDGVFLNIKPMLGDV